MSPRVLITKRRVKTLFSRHKSLDTSFSPPVKSNHDQKRRHISRHLCPWRSLTQNVFTTTQDTRELPRHSRSSSLDTERGGLCLDAHTASLGLFLCQASFDLHLSRDDRRAIAKLKACDDCCWRWTCNQAPGDYNRRRVLLIDDKDACEFKLN